MAARKSLDEHAGAPPEVRTERDSVIFHLDVIGGHQDARLLIRCDAQGEVWAALIPRPATP